MTSLRFGKYRPNFLLYYEFLSSKSNHEPSPLPIIKSYTAFLNYISP